MTRDYRYNTPRQRKGNRNQRHNTDFNRLNRDGEFHDSEVHLTSYAPVAGTKFVATDTNNEFIGDGHRWRPLHSSNQKPSFESLSDSEINDINVVKTEAELRDAVRSSRKIIFGADIELSAPIEAQIGGIRRIEIAGYTLKRAAGMNDHMLDIELGPDAHLTLFGGFIDGNRSEQNFPAIQADEVRVQGGRSFRVDTVAGFNNTNFMYRVTGVDSVIFLGPTVKTAPETLATPEQGAGLDGIHTYDCAEVAIIGPIIISGDDSIAIGAHNRSVGEATIEGGVVSSPVHANGIKFHIEEDASRDVSIDDIRVSTTVDNCAGHGIQLVNNSSRASGRGNSLGIHSVISNVGEDGINSLIPMDIVRINGQINNTGNHGIYLANGGGELQDSSIVENFEQAGIRLEGWDNASVRAVIDGRKTGRHGIELFDSSNIRLATVIQETTEDAIYAENTSHTVLNGSIIHDCGGAPARSLGNSTDWNVIGNSIHDNGDNSFALKGNNEIGFNSGGDDSIF